MRTAIIYRSDSVGAPGIHAVADGVYAALAEGLAAPLITCGGRLAQSHGHGADIEPITLTIASVPHSHIDKRGRPLSAATATLFSMEPGDLESRVAALEHEVRDLAARVQTSQQDAAAARVLAGAADRDVSGFRDELRDFRQAASASFNALREDFVDLRSDFSGLRSEFGALRSEFGLFKEHIDQGFIAMRGKFDAAAAGQQQIVDLLETIIPDRGANRSTE